MKEETLLQTIPTDTARLSPVTVPPYGTEVRDVLMTRGCSKAILCRSTDDATKIHVELDFEVKPRALDDGYAILQPYLRCPTQHTVLDAPNPEVAPHIVISRADEDEEYELGAVYAGNHAGEQNKVFLSVPALYRSTCRMARSEEGKRERNTEIEVEDMEMNGTRRKRGTFESVSQALGDSEDWDNFIRVLAHVMEFKAHIVVAFEASAKADAFRMRYDLPDFFEYIGWKDPADAIFAHRPKYSTKSTLVLKSDCPKIAPHIIIDLSPSNDLWALDVYPGLLPQDDKFLVATPAFAATHRVRSKEEIEEREVEIAQLDIEQLDREKLEIQSQLDLGMEYESDSESDSLFSSESELDTASVAPQTPRDSDMQLRRVGSSGSFFSIRASANEGGIEEDITEGYRGYIQYRFADKERCYRPETPAMKCYDDEDEDERDLW